MCSFVPAPLASCGVFEFHPCRGAVTSPIPPVILCCGSATSCCPSAGRRMTCFHFGLLGITLLGTEVWTCVFFGFGKIPKGGATGSQGHPMRFMWGKQPVCFPEWLHHSHRARVCPHLYHTATISFSCQHPSAAEIVCAVPRICISLMTKGGELAHI